MFKVFNSEKCILIKRYTEVRKKAVEEVEHIKADAALRAVSIKHPIREFTLIDIFGILLLDHITAAGAVLVQPLVQIAHAGIAVFRTACAPVLRVLAVGIGHVDKGRVLVARGLLRNPYHMTIWISSWHLLLCHLPVARNSTNARIGEPESLRLKVTFHGVAVVGIIIPLILLARLEMNIHLIIIRHLYMYITNLLAYLDAVFQRHVTALQVAYQVVERLLRGDVQAHAAIELVVLLHHGDARVQRQSVAIHHGGQSLHRHRTHVALHIVDVLHQVPVLLKRRVKRQ